MKKVTFNELIDQTYSKNGKECKSELDAIRFLTQAGYYMSNKQYRNKVGKTAYITRLKDHYWDTHGEKQVSYTGYLVTFGGEPLPPYKLILCRTFKED